MTPGTVPLWKGMVSFLCPKKPFLRLVMSGTVRSQGVNHSPQLIREPGWFQAMLIASHHFAKDRPFRRHARSLQRLLAAVMAMLTTLSIGCSDKPTAPDNPMIFAAYSEPALRRSDSTVLFNHTPLVRVYRNPRTRQKVYEFDVTQTGLWTVRFDGSGQHRVLPYAIGNPDWDSSGSALAYEVSGTIWTMAASDSGLVESTAREVAGGGGYGPTWNQSGELLAYSVHVGPGAGLYYVPSVGGFQRQVGSKYWRHPDWTPDGGTVVFAYSDSTGSGVGAADSSGSGYRSLWGYQHAYVGYARVSPSGSLVAFTARPADTEPVELWVMNNDGTSPHRVTSGGVQDYFCWGLSDAELIYVRYNPHDSNIQNGTIWILNTSTSSQRQLTRNSPVQ
jgi:hypothetical protein